MNNAPLIRITVTLSLIIALMIQPMVGVALAANCDDSQCVEQMICPGCGCCQIEQAGDRCCCCSSAEVEREIAETESVVESAGEITGVCLCGYSTPPMNRGNDREVTSEWIQLRIQALQLVDLLPETDPKSIHPRPTTLADVGHLARFSQRHLCIWRI